VARRVRWAAGVSDDSERALPPTPRRIAKARAKGNTARSAIATAALVLASGAGISTTLRSAEAWWLADARRAAESAAQSPRASAPELIAGIAGLLHAAAPWSVVACAWICATAATLFAAALCDGAPPAWSSLRIDGNRLSWVTGAKKLATLDAAGAAISVCGAAAVAWSSVAIARGAAGVASRGADFSADMAALGTAIAALWRSAVPLALIAGAADIVMQRARFLRNLRMTPRELKEERAESEGRPETKARRRSAALKRSRGMRISAIREATAVVTNPTHIAIALRYAPPLIDVPVVVARGADLLASVVRGAAESFGVPVVEAPELARLLYAHAETDDPIPEEAYAAVAAVFAWILRTRGALRGERTSEGEHDPEFAAP
jgi:flagellar biosynthetic protein FlhB